MNKTPPKKTLLTSLSGHLSELRRHLVWMLAYAACLYVLILWQLPHAVDLLRRPLESSQHFVYLHPLDNVLTRLHLAFILCGFILLPFIALHTWFYGRTALKRPWHVFVTGVVMLLFFYAGTLAGYLWVVPRALAFLQNFQQSETIAYVPAFGPYMLFVLKLSVAFGLVALLPIALFLAVSVGFVQPKTVRRKRKWVILFCFVLGAILTPPDPVSQLLMAIPLYLLFEIGLLLATMVRHVARPS